MKKNITIQIPYEEACLIRVWLGSQGLEDTERVIEEHVLDIDPHSTEDALYNLYSDIIDEIYGLKEKQYNSKVYNMLKEVKEGCNLCNENCLEGCCIYNICHGLFGKYVQPCDHTIEELYDMIFEEE